MKKRRIPALILIIMLLLSLLTIEPAFAASWYDSWTVSGGATIAGGRIVLNSPNGSESIAQMSWNPGGKKFDVEWTMTVNAYSGYENIQICTGAYRAILAVCGDKLSYHAPDASGSGFTLGYIYYPIGKDTHTYRVIGEGNQCKMYIDGNYLQDFLIEKNTQAAKLKVWNMGSESGTANMVVESFIAHTVRQDTGSSSASGAIHDTFDNNSKGWSLGGGWQISDGYLWNNNLSSKSEAVKKSLTFSDEYTITFRASTPKLGVSTGVQLFLPGKCLYISIKENRLLFTTKNGSVAGENFENLGEEFHEYKIESYNYSNSAVIYLDGMPVADVELADSTRTDYHIFIYNQAIEAENAIMKIDEFHFEPRENCISVLTPFDGAVYTEGQSVDLKANVTKDSGAVPFVEYKINGNTVAEGRAAKGYAASINSLPPGDYEMTVEYGDWKSPQILFTVKSSVSGTLNANLSDGSITASMELSDPLSGVASVEYLLDGVLKATASSVPYTKAISDVTPEAHTLTAIARNSSGLPIFEASKTLMPPLGSDTASMSYSNEISYTVSGDGESAAYELNNGNHRLYLKHTRSDVFYQTASGEESYPAGIGRFTIITEGPSADIYINGQLAFSYLMPQTKAVGQSFSENGMTFSEKNISIPENRKNYFVKRDVNDSEAVYHLSDIPYIHNIDFTADITDGARLVLNDGYYRTDISLENGKFYVWTTQFDKSEPFRKEIADALDMEDVYYRVETVAGMSRLYGNGKWLASFRNAHSVGNETFAVNITAGDGLDYLAVSDNTDLYLYQDDFSGTAEIPSADFWQLKNGMNLNVDTEKSVMSLDASALTDGIAEMTAYAGDASLSCDLTLTQLSGGFWFILSHSVTDVYTKIGYNAASQCFEIVNRKNDEISTEVRAAGTLPLNTPVHLEMKTEQLESGKRVTLYQDGTAIITQNLTAGQRGKIGFIMSGSTAEISSIAYRGDTKPVTGVTDSVHAATEIGPTMDLLERGNDLVMVSDAGKWMKSADGGKNWNIGSTVSGSSYNMIRLSEQKTGNWSERSKTYTGATGITSGGAVHLRFTPRAGAAMIEIYNGQYRLRLQNEGSGSNRLILYQQTGQVTFSNYPMTFGTTYDIIVFQRSSYYTCWAKTADQTSYTYVGKTTGMRASTNAASVVVKANTMTLDTYADAEIDYVKIYSPLSGASASSGSTEEALLSTVDTANPALSLDTDADFKAMNTGTIGAQGTETIANGILRMTTGYHTGIERTNEVLSVKRIKTGTDANGVGLYNYQTYYSSDNGASWTKRDGYLAAESVAGRITMNNRITQGKSGRIYFASCDNNNEDFGYTTIWYTDDKGVTWTKSETDFDARATGYCIQEVVCLETDEGIVRAYFRNNMGFVHYFNSYDYGKTWDLEHIYQTPFLSTLNCYNIELDPYDMKTLYAAWGYDNANLHGTDQYPRTRWAFARSRDGGETWEFLGTVHENNSINFTMMNLSINVAKDYIILNAFSDDKANSDAQSWSRVIVVKKDQLKPTADFEQLHMYDSEQLRNTNVVSPVLNKKTMLIHPKSRSVVLHGERIDNAAYNGYVDLSCAAAYVGAKVQMTGGSAVLTCGSSSVSISSSELMEISGKAYVKLTDFADKYNLKLIDENGTKILSTYAAWSTGQRQVLRATADLFAQSPTEQDPDNVITASESELLLGMNTVEPKVRLDSDEEFAAVLPTGDTSDVTRIDLPFLHGSGSTAKAEDGMLKLSAAAGDGEINCPTANDPDFQVGDTAHIRFTYHSGNCIFEIRSGDVRMRMNTGGGSSNLMVTGSDGFTSLSNTASVSETTYDYIIRNTESGFEYWRSTDRTNYTYLGTTAGKESNTGAYMRFNTAAGASMDVDFVKLYRSAGNIAADALASGAVVREFMQFDSTFNGREFLGSVIDSSVTASYSSSDESGLELTTDNFGDGYPGRWSKKTQRFAPLENEGDAVELSAKVPSSGRLTVELEDGNGHLARFYVYGSGSLEIDGSGDPVTAADSGIVGRWNTYLIRNEGDCFGVYIKKEGIEDFSGPVLFSNGKLSSDSSDGVIRLTGGNGIQTSGAGAQAYVKYYKLYSVGGVDDENTKPKNPVLLYSQEFTDQDALTGDKVLKANLAEAVNGSLKLTTKVMESNMGQYRISNLSIPAGGYADLRFRTDAPLKLKLFAPDTEFQIGLANTISQANCVDTTQNGGWKAFEGFTFEPNQYQNCRIMRSGDGTCYSIYMKKDGSGNWLKVIDSAKPRGNQAGEPNSLLLLRYGVGSDATEIDFLKIYGPNKSLTLTDGRDVSWAPSPKLPLSYPKELRAVVGKEVQGKLIFAGYDAKGALISLQSETIQSSGSESEAADKSFLFDASGGEIKKVKVFLWDGFESIMPYADYKAEFLTVN